MPKELHYKRVFSKLPAHAAYGSNASTAGKYCIHVVSPLPCMPPVMGDLFLGVGIAPLPHAFLRSCSLGLRHRASGNSEFALHILPVASQDAAASCCAVPSFLGPRTGSCAFQQPTNAITETLRYEHESFLLLEQSNLVMQRCLLHTTFPALTASFQRRVLSSLRCRPLHAQYRREKAATPLLVSIRAASAVAEAPSTDLGAGLPEIIETSNVPVSTASGSYGSQLWITRSLSVSSPI